MNPQTTSARRLLMFAIALNALPIMAQEGSPWRIAHPADSLTFFQSRMLNKNTVIAADAAHYAFVASRGPKGYVYLSNDTASTLALIRVDEHPIVHYDLAYPSRDHVYVIADSLEWVETQWKPVRGMIFSSSDRGATWDTTRMPDGVTLSRVAMVDVSEGIASAAVNSPVFYRTSDGWKTWTTIEFPAGRTSAFDLRAPANGTYVVDGVSLTTDAGATWQESTTPPSKGVARFDFIDALRGWGIGGLPNSISEADHRVFDRISRTTDGGRNWTPLVEATELRVDALLDVAFADERHGIATGMVGRVMATTDGGVTWSVERLPDSVNAMLQLTGIAHPVPGVAVAVGNGVILRRIVEPTSAGIDLPVSRAPALAPNPASGSTSVGFSLTERVEDRDHEPRPSRRRLAPRRARSRQTRGRPIPRRRRCRRRAEHGAAVGDAINGVPLCIGPPAFLLAVPDPLVILVGFPQVMATSSSLRSEADHIHVRVRGSFLRGSGSERTGYRRR